MKDFLFIASDYKPMPGGIAAYIDSLARGLRRIGNEAEVLAVVPSNEKERMAFLENYEDWVHPFPVANDQRPENWLEDKFVSLLEIVRCLCPNAGQLLERTSFFQSSFRAKSKFENFLAGERPSRIVFGHLDRRLYPFVLALIEGRLPYGVIAHDVEVYKHPIYRTNDRVVRGTILKGAKWIAANSSHTKSLIKMWGITDEKIIIVHPPLSEQVLKEAGDLHPIGRDSDYILVSMCRLVKSKGIDIVLRALKIVAEKGIAFQYLIAGDGDERQSLERLADELEMGRSVQFLGYVADDRRSAFMRRADVFVMPSRVNPRQHHEGFGLAFMEAAAFGIPAVGTRAGGIPDAVIHGETGLLVAQESAEELAQALIFLYQNPKRRREMASAAMERARAQFSPTAIADHFQKEVAQRMR